MTDRSPTPDLLPRFQTPRKLDRAEHGTVGRDFAPVIKGATDIKRSPAGPKDPMDTPTHRHETNNQPSLSTGGGAGRLNDAVKVNSHGGRAAKADYGFLRKG